jgi:hypothetical protein
MSAAESDRRLTFTNFGHRPATGFYVNGFLADDDPLEAGTIADYCNEAVKHAGSANRFKFYSILPNQPLIIDRVAKKDVDRVAKEDEEQKFLLISQITASKFPKGYGYLGGCIVYGWPDVAHLHTTGFWVDFRVSDGKLRWITSYSIPPN